MKPPITLRDVTAEDESFLYTVFKTGLGTQFSGLPWPPDDIGHLMKMQFDARSASYRSQYPRSEHSVVLVDGVAAGHIWVDRSKESINLIEIELLPSYRGSGIGSLLFQDLFDEAKQAGLPVLSGVATNNPGSLALHKRLGFKIISEDEMYWFLEWRA
jgi:ribosomal protein S18 acetylase RimI-like enzyme